MTKEEVRILSIAKLGIEKGFRCLDIGAGTGSIAVQMSLISGTGEIVAIERDSEALEVLQKNKEKFKVHNLRIMPGEAVFAAEALEGEFDAIFVGGSGGDIQEIIRLYSAKLKAGKNMLLNFITIDNLYKAMETLKALNWEIECTQLAVSKTKGQSYMLMANNPIFILKAVKSLGRNTDG